MILFHVPVQFWLNTVVRNKGNRLSLYRTSGKHLREFGLYRPVRGQAMESSTDLPAGAIVARKKLPR
ncbi:MAG: hypothetical protein RLO81_14720 [Fulvivirga sp.]|uniref:hypothetical protein n=1 Tax=Fulvivirga sp. TaxID=1931237 RepID=UPI0032EE5751